MGAKGLTEKIIFFAVLCFLGFVILQRMHKKAPEAGSAKPDAVPIIDSLPADPAVVKPPPKLVFDDPGQYGIITPDEWGSMPSEDQIRTTIRRQMELIRETTPPETWGKIQKAIAAPAEQTLESVKKLDERTELLRKKIEDDPFDGKAKQQLDLLIMLRAAAEELSPDVPAPVQPQLPEEADQKEVEIIIE